MDFLYILALTLGAYLVLFLLSKLMGYKELSQLSFLDYVIGITIGSIGAEMATNIDDDWWHGLEAMVILALLEILLSFLTRKSLKVREFVVGKPIIVMKNGEINRDALKKSQIEVNDLLSQAREQGYFNLSDIDYAIMETDGKLSFLPKPLNRALNPKDFNFSPERTGMCINLVIDGQIIEDNLVSAKLTEKKLDDIIAQRGLKKEDIFLLTVDETGSIEVYKK